jgi:hypothetical protein
MTPSTVLHDQTISWGGRREAMAAIPVFAVQGDAGNLVLCELIQSS